MNLVLRGLTLNDNALSQPLVGRFDERGGSVGRSDNATMTLPDPERLISRVQANVSFGANIYWLEDVGSANPVLHNGLPLGPGVKVPLKSNDELRIGGYRLAVEYEQADTSATVVRRPQPPARGAPAGGGAAVQASTPARVGANPFVDLLREGRGTADARSDLPPAAPRAGARNDAVPPGTRNSGRPVAFDPLSPFDADSAVPPPDEPRTPAAGRTPRGAAADPLMMFDLPATPPPAPPQAAPAPSATQVRNFDAALRAAGDSAAPARPRTSAKKSSSGSSGARRPATAGTPAQPLTPSSYTADEIWAGFLEGAGVDVALPRGVTPEMMRTVGLMMRLAVEGMLELIAVRAAAKNELHAPVTVIQVRENNPLKFSPDATVALMQLLQPPGRGFLKGPDAIREAMVDLQSHQIGTMAGMRAALAGVLERFQPELLEGRLTGQSVLDAVLPMNRKAKLWELFLQHYRAIRNDAEADFHELFGKAFVEAYNDQVEKLSQERAGDDADEPR